MWYSRFFSLLLGAIALVVESGKAAQQPYDKIRLQVVEDKAQSMDLDDASAVLDIVHDDTRKMQAAARSDRILQEARVDLWRKDQDKKDLVGLKALYASERAEDAVKERRTALDDATRARKSMTDAAKKKVNAEIRLDAAEKRVDDAEVHIEESMAKKEAAKIVESSPLAKMRAYHAPDAAAEARQYRANKRADAEERQEEAMAFVRADKDVMGQDHYKTPTVDSSSRPPVPMSQAEVEATKDQTEAQTEMAIAMESAGKKVRGMLGNAGLE